MVDKEIFNLSKESLRGIDGILTEKDKIDLIDLLYTTENLKNTEYYKFIRNNIDYVRSIEDFEKSKSEIKKIFRNINTITVIPKGVYDENYEAIRDCINIISQSYDKNLPQDKRKKVRQAKVLARNRLMDFTVSVQYYLIEGNIVDNIKLNRNEFLPVLNCSYSEELGIEAIKNKKEETSLESKFF